MLTYVRQVIRESCEYNFVTFEKKGKVAEKILPKMGNFLKKGKLQNFFSKKGKSWGLPDCSSDLNPASVRCLVSS
jgi:hypothetical protein